MISAGRQVAVETLLAGGAERRNRAHSPPASKCTQRAAVVLGNEHGFDGVAVADIEQPLARAVADSLSLKHRRRTRRRDGLELFAQDLAMSVMALEIVLPD
jgi:hypothetical protein